MFSSANKDIIVQTVFVDLLYSSNIDSMDINSPVPWYTVNQKKTILHQINRIDPPVQSLNRNLPIQNVRYTFQNDLW